MEKKQARSATKTPSNPKATLRKVTVRDLDARKDKDIKGGTESIRQRCR